ncbi:ferrous iron transport protein B, partial [candidate division KSB1 bacterium]|nr:ferrous iron transport protein B [candidate division KSB1 bacterium]
TLFNALTGLHQKVGNYPGVTVEKKLGTLEDAHGRRVELHDLPGVYSLIPQSLDEQIAVDEILGPRPPSRQFHSADLIIVVADATNLERHLYLALQILDLGVPVILALNMMDEAERCAIHVDIAGLSRRLEIPVIAVSAKRGSGIAELRAEIFSSLKKPFIATRGSYELPAEVQSFFAPVAAWLLEHGLAPERMVQAEALHVVSDDSALTKWVAHPQYQELFARVQHARMQLTQRKWGWRQAETRIRYAHLDRLLADFVQHGSTHNLSRSEKIDRVLTHRIFGPIILLIVLAFIFQTIFAWAEAPMNAIENLFVWLGAQITAILPEGVFADLIVNGALSGVGAVVVFLPQILALFFFLTLFEDTGYLARAAFMLDRFMVKLGLRGYSVIPLLSSFACAIPGIMATRTIKNPKDRLITIMVAPLLSCSARLPVYALMISAFIPDLPVLGIFSSQGLTLLGLYLLGIMMALVSAYVLKRFVIKGTSQTFIMELPAYRLPSWRTILWQMYERAKLFVLNAGKVILAISIVLWFLASYPKTESVGTNGSSAGITQTSPPILQSYAGRLGKMIEPAIAPLGFDWKIGIGLITAFAAREVMVGTLATIYNVANADESSVDLQQALREDRDPTTGEPVYTPLVALSLLVFFVLACQCMSTVAVVRRETNSWRWPIIMIVYMNVLAYLGALVVYQGGKFLGWG